MRTRDAGVRIYAEPAEAAIGEPVAWVLEVNHAARDKVALQAPGLPTDDALIVLAGPRKETQLSGEEARTTWRWEVLALEPGERPLPALEVTIGGTSQAADPGVLSVAGELAEGEDAPRAFTDFHDVESTAPVFGPLHAFVLLVLCASGLVAMRWRNKRKPPGEPALSPLERLEQLRLEPRAGVAETRALFFELSGVVRSAFDGHLEREPAMTAGLTDEEWLAGLLDSAAEGRIEAGVADKLEEVLTSSGVFKYGGEAPTPFAVDGVLAEARDMLSELERGERAA